MSSPEKIKESSQPNHMLEDLSSLPGYYAYKDGAIKRRKAINKFFLRAYVGFHVSIVKGANVVAGVLTAIKFGQELEAYPHLNTQTDFVGSVEDMIRRSIKGTIYPEENASTTRFSTVEAAKALLEHAAQTPDESLVKQFISESGAAIKLGGVLSAEFGEPIPSQVTSVIDRQILSFNPVDGDLTGLLKTLDLYVGDPNALIASDERAY